MKKAIVSGLVLTSVMASVLTACGGTAVEQINKETGKATPSSTVLKFWLRGNASEPLNKSLVADFKEYEQKHPNVKIVADFVPIADVETKWNAAFAGGTAPDLFDVGIVNLPSRAQLNQFAVLDSYIQKWEDKADIQENIINLGKFKEKVYGIGYAPTPYVFAYRKDFFQEAGLDPNSPPKNWDELKQYAMKLTKKDGNQVIRAGFDIPKQEDSLLFEIFARQNGNILVDEMNEVPVFDQPTAVEAVQYLVDLMPYSIPFADMNKVDNIPFTKGKSSMSYLLPDTIKNMINNDPSLVDKIGIVSNVPGKKPATFSGLRLFSMSEQSKNKDAAWDLITFLMSKDKMAARMKDTNTAVVRKSLVEDYIKLDPAFNKPVMDAISVGSGRPSVTWSPLYRKYATQGYEESAFKRKPVDQALKDAVTKLKEEISK
ncbi:ABC transporter substrate-binding protein [Paenibacillus piri]|uniref:ABC transporter substrate-binding protein n=1 Tax=Paenibacillus piri TaxID=2547395 RepID=A0A4R5KS45_9BACL|nr:ABC transporter substrate-binding protein [Paenibacillus piri]TDF98663.1 ABC transporter substrate-binding protein [Paenibacillus piri]